MNSAQALSLLRTLLQVAGVLIVDRGWADADTAQALGGALITLASTGWALYSRRSAGLVASAAALPGVALIETSPKIAAKVTNPKVKAA